MTAFSPVDGRNPEICGNEQRFRVGKRPSQSPYWSGWVTWSMTKSAVVLVWRLSLCLCREKRGERRRHKSEHSSSPNMSQATFTGEDSSNLRFF